MQFISLLIISIVQGIGEFLPISSSSNMAVILKLFSINESSFSIKIALHIGSLIALIIYFRKVLWNIILGLFTSKVNLKNTAINTLIIGTIPVIFISLLLHDFIKEFDSIKISGINLIIFGLFLNLADKKYYNKINFKNSVLRSLFIGCLQSIAIFSGVSRLGICITAGCICGMNRTDAISTSFLLAIPSITGALVLSLIKEENYSNILNSETILGIVITALVGIICLKSCISYMIKHGFTLITWYRIILGLIMIFLF